MRLEQLIASLRGRDPNKVVRNGFGEPDSYRGYYYEIAFAPKENTTIGEMLKNAESALGATFQGYKGGDFKMGPYTPCHLAEYGVCGDDDEITELMLEKMCDDPKPCPSCSAKDAELSRLRALESRLTEEGMATKVRWAMECTAGTQRIEYRIADILLAYVRGEGE